MGKLKSKIKKVLKDSSIFRNYFRIKDTQVPLKKRQYFFYKYIGYFIKDKKIYWPVHKLSNVSGNITVGINSSVGATPGCYIQGLGTIRIGDYTIIGPNVGIISANHSLKDYRLHKLDKVIIGNYCWVGMNSVILPGVELGDHTIVGAGSVVTKSFKEGHCILAGSPAKVVRKLQPNEVSNYRDEHEFYGYIPKDKFSEYKKRFLSE
ncbi:acyltransferase [Priestia megaterium]